MLLRRITGHVRDQNWTAIAIDFVIVVIGVYVGIEVSNWNERRVEAQRGQEYLDRLEADLVYNLQTLEQRRTYWTDVAREGRKALAFAEEGVLANDSAWETLRAFFHASQVWRFQFNDTTYQEMRSAGELSLIDAPDIRAELANYYVAVAPRRGEGMYMLLPDYRETVRSAMPSPIGRYYWRHCHVQDISKQQNLPCEAPVGEAEARDMLEELVQVPGLVRELRFWIDTLEMLVRLAGDDVQIAKNLAAQVGAARK